MRLNNPENNNIDGSLWTLVNKTADYVLLPEDSGKLFSNAGAMSSVSLMIPAGSICAVGDTRFAFRPNLTGFTFFIDFGSNGQRLFYSDASNDYAPVSSNGSLIPIDALSEGFYIEIFYIGDNKWQARSQFGRWVED